MSNNYGSANQFTTESFLDPYNIFMPQNRRELIGFQQDEYFMSEIFQQLQMTEPVEGNKWFTWVEPKKIEYLTATSSASAGGSDGAAVDVVINAADEHEDDENHTGDEQRVQNGRLKALLNGAGEHIDNAGDEDAEKRGIRRNII